MMMQEAAATYGARCPCGEDRARANREAATSQKSVTQELIGRLLLKKTLTHGLNNAQQNKQQQLPLRLSQQLNLKIPVGFGILPVINGFLIQIISNRHNEH